MARKKSEVLFPNLGVYYSGPPISLPDRALQDCLNVRISDGRLTNQGVGWSPFSTKWKLNGPVSLIDSYFDSTGAQKIMLASLTDLYEWVEADDTILYLTPRYATGQASCAGTTAVTGSGGTLWLANVKAGDAIHFGNNAQRSPTATEQPAGPSAAWYTVASVGSNTGIVLTAPGPSTGGAVNYTIRRRLTADANSTWSTELFHNSLPGPSDWWAGTNGVDPIFRWDGIATQVEDAGIAFTAKALLRWKNMAIYGNLNSSGDRRRSSIANSAIGDPFNVVTQEAGEYIAYDGVDDILSLFTLADNLVIYSTRHITMAAFVGPPEYIAFRSAVKGLGPIAPNAIADFGDTHEFIGSDAAYKFDGISVSEVHYHVMREVIRKIPPMRQNQINAHFAEETGEILWVTPLTTDASDASPERAYSQHYLEDVGNSPTPFTIREMPATATGYFERLDTLTWDQLAAIWATQNYRWDDRFFQGAYPLNLFGTADGHVFTLGTADTQNGAPISSFVRHGLRPTVDGRQRGIVARVLPFAEQMPSAAYSLGVKVHTSDQMGAATVDTGTLLFDLKQEGRRFVNPYKPGRFFSVEFGTYGINQVWTLQGYDVEVVPIGERGKGG